MEEKPPPGQPPLKYLYIALTRPNAKSIAWGMLRALDAAFHLGCSFVDSTLTVTVPGGAIITLAGADQENWIKRLEGQAFKLIIVDEAALYDINLEDLVLYSLNPMIVDYDGTICLIGRPGPVTQGFFWDITQPNASKRTPKGWEYFNWSTFENPYMSTKFKKEIDDLKRNKPGIEHTPQFQRNYLGLWVPDSEGNVYRFDPGVNQTSPGWEYVAKPGDRYVAGLDFGWDDSTAIGVAVWNPDSPKVIFLESEKHKEWLLSDVCKHIEALLERYPGLQIYGDPARKQLFMEISSRFGQCINIAAKEDKRDHIEIFNATALAGNILWYEPKNREYIDEMIALKKYWPPGVKSKGWIEHPKQHNDLCDQGLYAFRHVYAYLHVPKEPELEPGTPEALEAEADEMLQRELRRHSKRKQWWRT